MPSKSSEPVHPKPLSKQDGRAMLLRYCKDIHDWPSSWEIDCADHEVGQAILEQFIPFLIDKIQQGRAKRTIHTYTRYLWVLGGELIRHINTYEADRRLPAKSLLLNSINEKGGPYWHDAFNEEEHHRYDSVCRLLYKFMSAKSD